MDSIRQQKKIKISSKAAKRRRIELKKIRECFRKKKKKSGGIKYQENCGIEVDQDDTNGIVSTSGTVISNRIFDVDSLTFPDVSVDCKIVYFDLETSGFLKTADILQIAATCNDISFSVYINPTQLIHQKASDATGLRNIKGELYYNNIKVNSIPLHDALLAFHQYLHTYCNPCILVAHNASFDASHLLLAIKNCLMLNDFNFVAGYTDSLAILRRKIPDRKGEGMFELSVLAKDLLNIYSNDNFHEAMYDVIIFKKIVDLMLTIDDLLINSQCFFEPLLYNNLDSLKSVISTMMIKRLSKKGISFNKLKKKFVENGEEGLSQILKETIKHKKTSHKVIDYFKNMNV